MTKLYSLLLVLLLGLGFYFKVLSVDPVSCILLGVLLWNNSVNMARQQQLGEFMSKSYSTLASNQKEILRAINAVRSDVRNKK